ncbi:MAG TPA: hypothetical protein VEL76_36430, partial [Gemmataceae bacterium]|nr:hypothetical protein [Gemmataceae bacterium]
MQVFILVLLSAEVAGHDPPVVPAFVESAPRKASRKGKPRRPRVRERLRVETLEKRELLNNETPFIKVVTPSDGGSSTLAM